MKKTLKVLFTFAILFLGISNVNAWTMNDAWYYGQKDGYGTWLDNAPSDLVNYGKYNITNNGESYDGICLDPTKDAPGTGTEFSNVTAVHTALNHGINRGLLTIASMINTNSGSGVAAADTAVRLFSLTAGSATKGTSEDGGSRAGYNYILTNTAVKWLDELDNYNGKNLSANAFKKYASCKNSTKCYFSNIGLSGLKSIGSKTAYDKTKVLDENNAIVKEAKKMYIAAMEAAAATEADMKLNDFKLKTSEDTEIKDVNGEFIRYDYYDITLGAGETIENVSLSCSNCDADKKVEIVSYIINDTETKVNATELKNNAFIGAKTITFKVRGSIKVDNDYDCTPLKYKVTFRASSTKNITEAYIVSNPTDSTQRFFAFKTGGVSEIDNDLTMDFCEGDGYCKYYDPEDFEEMTDKEFEDYTEDCCDDLPKYCEDSDNPNSQYYCDLYDNYCGACDTEISIPKICTYIDGEEGEETAENTTGYVKSAVDEDGNENIKACLLRRKKDEAGNTYKALENSYCNVYCKEDFTFDLPAATSVNSGTYFQLEATVSGTKTCYTSEINTEQFKNDISSLSVGSDEYNKKVAEYNACINMEVDYSCFDPIIEYDYEEVYNDQLGENDEFVQTGDLVETNKSTTYCNGDINDDYSCTTNSTKEVSNINGVAFTTKYVKSTVKKTGVYKTPSVFYRLPSGVVTTDKEAANATLVNGLPVAIKTESGDHKFKLNITNLGEYYGTESCKNGRIIGGDDSIFNKQLANGLTTNAEYQCYYYVNCPECNFGCEGPLCEIDQCDGNNCVATCVGNGCAYDNGAGLSYAYRTISLNNINPNNRTLGYNWSNSEKAEATITEIEEAGENAYDNAEYSFTLTPALITAIKQYNKERLNSGGYADESLSCSNDDYGNINVNCESDFISKLATGEFGNAEITIPNEDNKFTSWLDSPYCLNNGTCTIKNGTGPSWK